MTAFGKPVVPLVIIIANIDGDIAKDRAVDGIGGHSRQQAFPLPAGIHGDPPDVGRQPARDLVHGLGVGGVVEDALRLGNPQRVDEFLDRAPCVERHPGRTRPPDAELGHDAFDAVRSERGDALLLGDAEFAQQVGDTPMPPAPGCR